MGEEIKAVVFDMDGVLLDSETICDRIWRRLADEMKLPDIEDAIVENRGCNTDLMAEQLIARYGKDFDQPKFFEDFRKYFYEVENTTGIPLMAEVVETLDYLKSRNYRLALATSTRRSTAERQLKAVKIFDYFEVTTFGDEIKHSKPAPDIYLKAASELGVDPSECVAVEDSFNGIRSCHAAGYKPVMVPDRIQPDKEMEELCWKIGKPISVLRQFL
ncbi:MAG: HAD family phosphatase [Treponema sp.]|uniref:HAD family hydrolase n=1 Tax=Treponema sp. TaxID=166 RepID=UPI00298EB10B|nr:HAD family phosphatase [Treponema sp.]MCQ2601543.1 HAD family phosphatase [Treponema sp.]